MPKWFTKIIKKIKKRIDKWFRNRIAYKINKENNKHDIESSKTFDDNAMKFLEKIFGADLIKQDSNMYRRKKAIYQNDSKQRKVEMELEKENQNIIIKLNDEQIITNLYADKEENVNKKLKINRIENRENESNFYKETRRTKKEDN